MTKETYQEIKRISGEELRELLSDLTMSSILVPAQCYVAAS